MVNNLLAVIRMHNYQIRPKNLEKIILKLTILKVQRL